MLLNKIGTVCLPVFLFWFQIIYIKLCEILKEKLCI